jgi:transposase-like protein
METMIASMACCEALVTRLDFLRSFRDGIEDGVMDTHEHTNQPSQRRYTPEEKAQAVHLVRQLCREFGPELGTVGRVARQLGHETESVQAWVRQADIDEGHEPKTTTEDARRIKELEQENKELKRANEILENEHRSLHKAHLADAGPVELLGEEQARITDELAKARALMPNAEIHWEQFERNLRHALALASNLGSTYAKANEKVRRQMNEAIFEEILVEVDGSVVYARMAQPFAAFHDEEFRTWGVNYGENSGPFQDRGSNTDTLVEVRCRYSNSAEVLADLRALGKLTS